MTTQPISSKSQARRPALMPSDADLSKADVKDIMKRSGGVITKMDDGVLEDDCKKRKARTDVEDFKGGAKGREDGMSREKENRGKSGFSGHSEPSERKKVVGKAVANEGRGSSIKARELIS